VWALFLPLNFNLMKINVCVTEVITMTSVLLIIIGAGIIGLTYDCKITAFPLIGCALFSIGCILGLIIIIQKN
jgi:hypothetical protein